MNKIIPFNKTIKLKEKVKEITKIALDDTLKLEDPYLIKGDLVIRGCYKTEEKEEVFSFPIPVEIAIDSKYDTTSCTISIDNFYYELLNDQDLKIQIDLLLDNLYYQEEKNQEVDLFQDETKTEDLVIEPNKLDQIFKDNNPNKEYSIYRVYTVLDGETLEYILDKYKVSRDDLSPFNDLDNFKPGYKLIIPSDNE